MEASPGPQYTYKWEFIPYANTRQGEDLKEKIVLLVSKWDSEGWEPVGLPFVDRSVLLRKRNGRH